MCDVKHFTHVHFVGGHTDGNIAILRNAVVWCSLRLAPIIMNSFVVVYT